MGSFFFALLSLLGLAGFTSSRCGCPNICARFSPEMQHRTTQEPIRLSLVATAIGFKPSDNVGIEAHRYGLFLRPVKLANFGPTPIKDWGSICEINDLVSFSRDGSDVPLLRLCELLHTLSFRVTPQHGPK
jgi:hypothetical protein